VEVAREHFAFRPGETARILIGDGRRVLDREVVRTDAILLDAFFSEGVPFHLTTREFFELCRSRLSPDGVFVANFVGGLTGARNGLFWAAVKTLQEVFPGVVVLQDELVDQHSVFFGNAIVIATNAPGLRKEDLRSRAFNLARTASRPEMMLWAARFFPGPYPVADVPVLTDDYSPTDALQHLSWK
jgi:spermidine synthase